MIPDVMECEYCVASPDEVSWESDALECVFDVLVQTMYSTSFEYGLMKANALVLSQT